LIDTDLRGLFFSPELRQPQILGCPHPSRTLRIGVPASFAGGAGWVGSQDPASRKPVLPVISTDPERSRMVFTASS
jgi:hypothetical protein